MVRVGFDFLPQAHDGVIDRPCRHVRVHIAPHFLQQLLAVHNLLAALRETGQERNTLVVFSSDNGGSLPHAQNNDPWRDGKQSHYDGGLRVPFLMRWPARIAAGSQSDYAGLNFDLFPTVIELAGQQPSAKLDAVSLVPLFDGKTIDRPRDLYFVRREGGPAYGGKSYEALIRGPWKLLQNDPFSPRELYHLEDDPAEQHNLAASRPQMVRELSTALQGHIQRGGRTPWQPSSPAQTQRTVGPMDR